MIPPYVIDVRVDARDRRSFHLWLPLFLLWPLLLVLSVLSLVLTILVDVALWASGQSYHHYTFLLLGCFGLMAQLRDTSVHVQAPDALVHIAVK